MPALIRWIARRAQIPERIEVRGATEMLAALSLDLHSLATVRAARSLAAMMHRGRAVSDFVFSRTLLSDFMAEFRLYCGHDG